MQTITSDMNEADKQSFEQFCHLSARRIQYLARLTFRTLTGLPMAGEPHDQNPEVPRHGLQCCLVRMLHIYRESSHVLRRKLAEAEAQLQHCPVEVAEEHLSKLEGMLSEVEAERKAKN